MEVRCKLDAQAALPWGNTPILTGYILVSFVQTIAHSKIVEKNSSRRSDTVWTLWFLILKLGLQLIVNFFPVSHYLHYQYHQYFHYQNSHLILGHWCLTHVISVVMQILCSVCSHDWMKREWNFTVSMQHGNVIMGRSVDLIEEINIERVIRKNNELVWREGSYITVT